MRLLLDEHFDPRLAQELRRRGHDVVAVVEDLALRGLSDAELLDLGTAQGRAVVSYDAGDFGPLAEERQVAGAPFAGVVLVSARAFPPGERHHGRLLRALIAVLKEHPSAKALADRIVWLAQGSGE